MLLSVHATVGAVIGEQVDSALLAFVLAFISHFLLDIIPHGDEAVIKEYRNGFKNKGMKYLIVFDIVSTIILLPVLFISQNISFNLIVIWGIIGGILPDILVAIHEVSHKYFKRTHKFHYWAHDRISTKMHWTMPLKFGLIFQLIIIYLILK